jgi:hypothetical protein
MFLKLCRQWNGCLVVRAEEEEERKSADSGVGDDATVAGHGSGGDGGAGDIQSRMAMASEKSNVLLHVNWGDSNVTTMDPGMWHDFSSTKRPQKIGVVATSPYSSTFEGVRQMDMGTFIDRGNQEGAALLLA